MNDEQRTRARDVLRQHLAPEGRKAKRDQLTAAGLSRKIGRGKDYIRNFLDGAKDSIGVAETMAIERELGLGSGGLFGGADSGNAPGERNGESDRPTPNARLAPGPLPDLPRLSGPRNVPVFGTSVGGGEDDSDFEFNGETIDHLPRPASIAHRDKVYAMYVEGESMWPKYEPGDPIYVDPSRAPRPGEYCVVEVLPEQEGGRGKGFIKRLVKRTPTKVIVEQFNPRREIEFEAIKVRLHRVIPWPELLGV